MITLYGINLEIIIGIRNTKRNGPLNECEPTRHNRADSSLHLMLFLCYTLCFNSVSCYFNSVAMHMFDGNARMHPTPRGHLFCKKISFAPNSAKRERFGIKNPGRWVLEIPTVQFFVNRHRKSEFFRNSIVCRVNLIMQYCVVLILSKWQKSIVCNVIIILSINSV